MPPVFQAVLDTGQPHTHLQLSCHQYRLVCCACGCCLQGGDLYSALRHHSETMKWERLGRKVALDVALGLNYLHAQVQRHTVLGQP